MTIRKWPSKSKSERKMGSYRQPSLPGFPDIPDKLDVAIPNMPMWEQIGGDMDPGAHGGLIATANGDHIELLEIQPVRNAVGDDEAKDVGFPFWTKEGYYDLDDLDLGKDDVKSALRYTGFTEGDQKHWFEEEATPEQRALVIAEALHSYGSGTHEGPTGWSEDLPDHEVKWWGDKVATLPEYVADEDEAFRDDVLGYSDIRQKLEEMVEQMANGSSAQSWSTVGDRAADDAAHDGYDPKTLVGVAEFGDAVAVNGDIETEKTLEGVEADLEKDGFEMLPDGGGKVPTDEAMVDPESAIRAVAREMGLDKETVEKAAEGIDWWPKESDEEIASSTSGYAYIYGKKDKGRSVEDPDYVIQPLWSDGTIVGGLGGSVGSFGFDDEEVAIREAKKMLRDPTFEGDSVRVITRDGDLVWSSEEGLDEPKRSRRRR